MSREIKFRAWDKNLSRWAYSTEINIEGSGQVIHNHFKHYYPGESLPEKMIGCEHLEPVQQFTGLKDKNGRDLYEGDIVRLGPGYKADVYWDNHAARFLLHPIGRYVANTRAITTVPLQGKIIGNIYENPELLGE